MQLPGDTGSKTMTNTTSKTRHVRIEGDGSSPGTRIIDTSTGEAISRVQGFTVTQRVGHVAKAVIEVALPQVSLECEAEVREVRPSTNLTPTDVRWAEDLIRQLPADHEGRNSWLLNFGSAAPDLRPAASEDDL